jgi:hypothetical protein
VLELIRTAKSELDDALPFARTANESSGVDRNESKLTRA